MILISKFRTSASKKINLMALIRTLTMSTATFERMKEKFYGFRQTVQASHSDQAMTKDISLFCIASKTEFVQLRSQFLIKGNVNVTKQTQPISKFKLSHFLAISASTIS